MRHTVQKNEERQMIEVRMREEGSKIHEGIGVNRTPHSWYVWVKDGEEVVMLRLPLESSQVEGPSYTAFVSGEAVTTEELK
jgi:hypothetical protein